MDPSGNKICIKRVQRCPFKSQVTTVNQVRDAALAFCHAQPSFKSPSQDMYSSECGKFAQEMVNQTLLQYGYSKCQKKIQPSVYWYK